jgi:hypothetical protein
VCIAKSSHIKLNYKKKIAESTKTETHGAISSAGVPQLPRPDPSRLISFLMQRGIKILMPSDEGNFMVNTEYIKMNISVTKY